MSRRHASLNCFRSFPKSIATSTRVVSAAEQALAGGKVQADLMGHNLATLQLVGEDSEEVRVMWICYKFKTKSWGIWGFQMLACKEF